MVIESTLLAMIVCLRYFPQRRTASLCQFGKVHVNSVRNLIYSCPVAGISRPPIRHNNSQFAPKRYLPDIAHTTMYYQQDSDSHRVEEPGGLFRYWKSVWKDSLVFPIAVQIWLVDSPCWNPNHKNSPHCLAGDVRWDLVYDHLREFPTTRAGTEYMQTKQWDRILVNGSDKGIASRRPS